METRILHYFLTVAKTRNITQAAQQLHITQPTLSRQLKQLEDQLGTPLFIRGKREITLTVAGQILERQAKKILMMIAQTQEEIKLSNQQQLSGSINLGCVESNVTYFVDDLIAQFQAQYPLVKINNYSADGDDLKAQMDEDFLDLSFLIEPIEAAKYHYISLPIYEKWGLYVNQNHPLAQKQTLTADDLADYPLILPRRSIVQNELSAVIGIDVDKLNVKMTLNLSSNAFPLVEKYNYCLFSIGGIGKLNLYPNITFIPFENYFRTGHGLAWRKNSHYSAAVKTFIDFVKEHV